MDQEAIDEEEAPEEGEFIADLAIENSKQPEDEEYQEQETEDPYSRIQDWLCPPPQDLPLQYQKNKLYYQIRIDQITPTPEPTTTSGPKIMIGFCTDDFDHERDLSTQDTVWCINLENGEAFHRAEWTPYYQDDAE